MGVCHDRTDDLARGAAAGGKRRLIDA